MCILNRWNADAHADEIHADTDRMPMPAPMPLRCRCRCRWDTDERLMPMRCRYRCITESPAASRKLIAMLLMPISEIKYTGADSWYRRCLCRNMMLTMPMPIVGVDDADSDICYQRIGHTWTEDAWNQKPCAWRAKRCPSPWRSSLPRAAHQTIKKLMVFESFIIKWANGIGHSMILIAQLRKLLKN